MVRRSSRVLEILRETIEQAEQTSELGPDDPGVVELKRLLARWLDEWQQDLQRENSQSDVPADGEPESNGKELA
jgi:hypothetical protein